MAAANDPIQDLNGLLTSSMFSRQNAERVARVCYDAARLVYERQKHTGKQQLKTKEVSAALILAETLHSSAFRFLAAGPLVELFGRQCDEATALEYYEKRVMGEVRDKYSHKIIIDEDGIKSMYKDPSSGGRHVVASANYEEVRGKRLPWIRHTIQNCDALYVLDEPIGRSGVRRTYLYTAIVSIRLHHQSEQTTYYLVVVREGKNQMLRMVTAYSMFDRDSFLHAIAMSVRYAIENKGVKDESGSVVAASNNRSQDTDSGDTILVEPR